MPETLTRSAAPTDPTKPQDAKPQDAKPQKAREDALRAAQRLCELLRPVCARVEIAGSLRRGKPFVSDVEVCALPAQDGGGDLFGGEVAGPYVFGEPFRALLKRLQATGDLTLDPANIKDGPRYKRFLLPDTRCPDFPRGVGADLFLADPDNWGNTLAIRTGSAAFSEFLMGRAKRRWRRQGGGYLWQLNPGSPMDGPIPKNAVRVPCPEEEAYFRAVGVRWLPPHERNEAGIEMLRREAARD